MGKSVKIPVCVALLIVIFCHTHALIHNRIPQHHKVRHKHNVHHFSDRHVNEIREAFDDYKSTLHTPKTSKVTFEDAIKIKSFRHHRKNDVKLSDELTPSASDVNIVNSETSIANTMTRYKRVHTTEPTTAATTIDKFSDNYDEEYDDDDDGKTSKKKNDAGVKVQVSCVIE